MTTPDRRILPAAQAQLIDAQGRATQPWYDFFRRLVSAAQSIPSNLLGASFITATNETSLLPHSRRLDAGTNITLDDTVDGQLRISASAGTSADAGYPAQLGHAGI
jgi:hypothetical protein